MAILRHSRIALTMDIYTQVPDKTTREALQRLSDLFGDPQADDASHAAPGDGTEGPPEGAVALVFQLSPPGADLTGLLPAKLGQVSPPVGLGQGHTAAPRARFGVPRWPNSPAPTEVAGRPYRVAAPLPLSSLGLSRGISGGCLFV
jgi:hypothetical protein